MSDSHVLTLQNNLVTSIHESTGYLDAVLDPFADFAAGQVRGVGDIKPVLNLSLLVPTSVLVVFGGEYKKGTQGSYDGAAKETTMLWYLYCAVSNYSVAQEGLAPLYQLEDDLIEALEAYPLATAETEMSQTKTFFEDFKPWTDTDTSIIWRATFSCPYLRKSRRSMP